MSLYDDRIKSVKFTSGSGPNEAERQSAINSFGDDLTEYLWDGPEDSDEEIAEMIPFKNKFEIEMNVKFSKNGIKQIIEQMIARESN